MNLRQVDERADSDMDSQKGRTRLTTVQFARAESSGFLGNIGEDLDYAQEDSAEEEEGDCHADCDCSALATRADLAQGDVIALGSVPLEV